MARVAEGPTDTMTCVSSFFPLIRSVGPSDPGSLGMVHPGVARHPRDARMLVRNGSETRAIADTTQHVKEKQQTET